MQSIIQSVSKKRQRYHITNLHPSRGFVTAFRSRPYPYSPIKDQNHGATLMPIDLACEMILLHNPCSPSPDNRDSDCLMRAISYTCFNDTCPTESWPGFMAPRTRFLRGSTFAACNSSQDVAGVRRSNVNDRSGRTVTRAGMGTPGLICAVRALNSCMSKIVSTTLAHCPPVCPPGYRTDIKILALQKSMLFTPLLPNAGPTGGLGLA